MEKAKVGKAGPAVLPAHRSDPTGVDRLERGAMRRFGKVMRQANKAYRDLLDKIPARAIQVNRVYEYQLDEGLLMTLLNDAGRFVDSLLMDEFGGGTWFFEDYVSKAAERGAGQARINLSRQARISPSEMINLPQYRLRMALVKAREFEEMQGLAAGIKADLSRVLTDGIGRGINPLEVARNISGQTEIHIHRAERIARTEIPTALRRARMEEDEQIMEDFGLRMMQMHFSALSPTTRPHHAARHGELYTIEQQQQWWSVDANAINCKCTTIGVLVDGDGTPLDSGVVQRAKSIKRRVEARRA